MSDSTDVSPVTLPSPRPPLDNATPMPAMPAAPAQTQPAQAQAQPAQPQRAQPQPAPARRRFPLGTLVLVLLVLATGGYVFGTADRPAGAIRTAARPARPLTPFEQAEKTLNAQATALVQADRAGWLAAVDPKQPALRLRYQNLYRSLQALHVTQLTYHAYFAAQPPGSILINAEMVYCLSATNCPKWSPSNDVGAPRVMQELILKPSGSRWVITRLAKAGQPTELQPAPWEAGDLVYAQGKRVRAIA